MRSLVLTQREESVLLAIGDESLFILNITERINSAGDTVSINSVGGCVISLAVRGLLESDQAKDSRNNLRNRYRITPEGKQALEKIQQFRQRLV